MMDILNQFIETLNPTVLNVFLIVFATVVARYAANRFFAHLSVRVETTHNNWDDALVHSIKRPASLLIWVIGLSWAAEVILTESDAAIEELIDPARFVAIIVLLGMFVTGFISRAEQAFVQDDMDETTVNMIGKLLRISVTITAGLMILQTLGVSISGVLAFGGVGGIAIGVAAQDLLANFFGGMMIYLDKPFKVGDWIRSPDRQIEGTVEIIGWRLTLIRTFDQRPLYVPNSVFTNIAVENPSGMHNRRIYETIGIRYKDAPKMQQIVEDVKSMLETSPEIDKSRTLMVNFNAFAPSSMDFFIYTFSKTTDWVEFHGVKQMILLKVLDIIKGHGAETAFPTSTVHITNQMPGPEPDSGQSAVQKSPE
jgi:MscS family membrane protein